jgi:phage tail P2-like protein
MANLLPPNSTLFERAMVEAMAPRLDEAADRIRALWNPATCPIELLPLLAWSLSVDIWDDTWSEDAKRAAIAGSIAWHRRKGTPWAVKQVLTSIGFDRCEIIEHRILHDAWIAAGGELLDGVGYIDGTGDLSAPPGDFRFVTHHWAEYALRLNVAEQTWVTSRQREIKQICEAYGPARSHLVAIILSALYDFDCTVTMGAFAARGHSVFDGCRRFRVAKFDTLDGCDIIGGTSIPELLDGIGTLNGDSDLRGLLAQGEPLDAGQLDVTWRGRSAYAAVPLLGGLRIEAPETLGDGMLLDGRYTISGDLLDGIDTLDGTGDLFYPMLSTPDDCLDGTSNLGEMPGPDTVWCNGYMRVTRGAHTYLEPMT